MAKPKPDRHSLDSQLSASIQDLKGAIRDHRQACLELSRAPEDPERQHAVAELEAEIAQHEQAIARLEAAKLAESEGAVQQAEADRIEQAKRAAKAVHELAPRIRDTTQRLVDAFEEIIAPALSELAALQRERSTQAWAVASAAKRRGGVSVAALDRLVGDSALSSALLGAIVRSGLGSIGPQLGPYITVAPPLGGVGLPDHNLAALDTQSQRLDDFLADAIEQATNPQTVTIEE